MAIEVSFEIVHEKCSQIAYQAFNESSLDKYPAGFNISLVGKDPFFPESVTQDPGRAKAFLNGAVLSNKTVNLALSDGQIHIFKNRMRSIFFIDVAQ